MKNISYIEYRRRVFNTALLECFSTIQESCVKDETACGDCHADNLMNISKKMSDNFYKNLLDLENSTIEATKKKLANSVTFIKDCVSVCESIAADKYDKAREAGLEIPEDQQIELGEEGEALIEKLFDEKSPDLQVAAVRDATVTALLAEDKKAQEIKDSLDIAQSQVAAGGDPKVMEETVNRLGNRGPTSLMNAIINAVSAMAVKDVNEASTSPVSVGKVMSENRQEIKDRACILYCLYEASSVFGIKKYTPQEVQKIAEAIYYNKDI